MIKGAAIFLCLVLPGSALAQSPIVRARLSPASGILVGQPVRLSVTVLVPNYFTGAPVFPEIELENAIVVTPQDRPQHSNERIGDVTYAGIGETYTLYPQRPGDFSVPRADITVSYAIAAPKSIVVEVAIPALSFRADIPARAQGLDYFLPTTQLTLRQGWSVPLRNLRAGDSVERTLIVTASRMQAMLIPPLPFAAPNGIRVYPEEPVIEDHKTSHGDFAYGRRTESAKYFIQKEGNYTLPPLELKWWNLSTGQLATASLPAIHFAASVNASYVPEISPAPETVAGTAAKPALSWTRYRLLICIIASCCLAILAVALLARRFGRGMSRRISAARTRRRNSESAYFRRLKLACHRDRAAEAYGALLKWLALADPESSLDRFVLSSADLSLRQETGLLGAMLFSEARPDPVWRGAKLASLLKKERGRLQAHSRKNPDSLKLNP